MDKSILVFLAALITGFLESHGIWSSQSHNVNLQIAQTYAGDALDIIAVVAWFVQHHLTQKIKIQNGTIDIPQTTINIKGFIQSVKNYFLTKFTNTNTASSPSSVNQPPPQA